jgi:predicted nucleic acid-binding protein
VGLKIALDSNIFIYALEDEGMLADKSRELLFRIKETSNHVFTSVLTIQEVLVGVYKEGLVNKVNSYLNFILNADNISIIDLSMDIAIKSAQIRAKFVQIRTPDAIHLATAISQKVDEFYTVDKRLPKKIENLRIVSI